MSKLDQALHRLDEVRATEADQEDVVYRLDSAGCNTAAARALLKVFRDKLELRRWQRGLCDS